MSLNVPSVETARYSFGPGILYYGPAGATPTIDVGAVKGDAEMSIERVPLEVKQGSPQSLSKTYVVEENISLNITGIEWNMDNIAIALGAGITSLNGAEEILEFGGDADHSKQAVRFLHLMPDGSTIDIHLFEAEGSGEMSLSMKETDIHEFPFVFKALEGNTDFEGAALAANKKKFKIIHTRA